MKGIAFATGAEVVGVDSFDALVFGVEEAIAVARGRQGRGLSTASARGDPGHAPLATLPDLIREQANDLAPKAIFLGLPAVSMPGALTEPPHDVPRATSIGRIAMLRGPSDLDALEPFYVRPPEITMPKVRTLPIPVR